MAVVVLLQTSYASREVVETRGMHRGVANPGQTMVPEKAAGQRVWLDEGVYRR